MQLSAEQRTGLINGLITNCDCWDEEDRKVLSGFDDSKLVSIAQQTVNQGQTGNEGSAKKKNAKFENISDEEFEEEMKRRKDAKNKSASGSNPASTTNAPQTAPQLSDEEWLACAPAAIVNSVKAAQTIENERKTVLINQLTAHLADDVKKSQAERLQNRSVEDLTNDLALIGNAGTENAAEGAKGGDNWLETVLSSTAQPSAANQPLTVPVINWAEDGNQSTQSTPSASGSNSEQTKAYLQNAPGPIRDMLNRALRVENRERTVAIEKLTEGLPIDSKTKVREVLANKTISELNVLLSLRPSTPASKPNYAGAAAPTGVANVRGARVDSSDILPLPRIDWKKEA